MKHYVLPLLVIGLLCISLSFCQTSALKPSPAESKYAALFETTWRIINDNFYDPSFLGVDWNAVGERSRVKLPTIHDDAAFLLLMSQMLQELPTSHLHLRPPEGQATTGIGVGATLIDGQQVITDVDFGSDAARHGLRPGDVIVSSREKVRGNWGSSVQVEVERCDGKTQKIETAREPYDWPSVHPSLRWRLIARSPTLKLGYVKVAHFDDDVAPLVDRAMEELHDTAGVIIDVRNNTGGNASFVRLLSYVTPNSQIAFALLSRPFLNQFGKAPEQMDSSAISRLPKVVGAYTTTNIIDAFRKNGGGAAYYTEDVGTRAYPGKVVVLTNQRTASAAEGFVWAIRGKPNVSIVGQATAGAVVGGEDFELPGGWRLTVPTHGAWGPDGRIYRDQKSIPDINIPLSRADFCHGIDPEMNKALDLVAPSSSR